MDLIFTNQPDRIVNSGTHPSFHDKCQHQVTFAKARLELNTLHLITAMSGIIQKLTLMEQIKP